MASPASGPTPASSSAVSIELRPEGYAILTLAREPVNSLDLATWQQLQAALDELEASPKVQGVIITTGLKRDVFSAGNDLTELYAPRTSEARYHEFWVVSNRFLARLHNSRLATIAAIRGACPAGGCIISMCCDHRVMAAGPGASIGLNEVQLGIPVPKYWAALMVRLVGQKAADKLLLTGKLVQPQEARTLGLVDEVVPREALLPAAEKVMQQLVKLPASAVAATKNSMRGEFCAAWEAFAHEEPAGAWRFLNQPDTLRTLGGVMQRLSGGSAAKPKL